MLDTFIDFNSQNVNKLAKVADELQLDKEIVDQILSWQTVLLDEVKFVTDPDFTPTDFQSLCHADLWLNNIMFTNDKNSKSADAVLVRLTLYETFAIAHNILPLFRLTSKSPTGIALVEISSTFLSHPSPRKSSSADSIILFDTITMFFSIRCRNCV